MNQELVQEDLSKILSIQQKRTLAFVNHFVLTNVQFLNNFMKNCEHKFVMFERKLEKVNAAMVLLETRLCSIPEINTQQTESIEALASDKSSNTITQETTESPQNPDETDSTKPSSENIEQIQSSKSRPEYDRFVKMVQVGVPLQAVKLKVSLEGLNPNVLDEILRK